MNILFAGTPNSSSRILQHLINVKSINIKGVITQPDKRGKRGKDLLESEVSKVAKTAGLDIFKPDNLNNQDFVEKIKLLKIDYIIVVAYGRLIPRWLLELPKIMALNIHYSILPKYRGASPIQSSLINGDTITGVTFMKMTEALDEGMVLSTHKLDIENDDNKITLEEKLTELSIEHVTRVMVDAKKGVFSFREQENHLATYCKKILKEDSISNFDNNAVNIINKFRAFFEWPGLNFKFKDTLIKIHDISISNEKSNGLPGTINKIDKSGVYVNTRDAVVVITHLQFPNKNKISSTDVFNSYASFFK